MPDTCSHTSWRADPPTTTFLIPAKPLWSSDSQPGVHLLPHPRNLVVSGDVFDCHNGVGWIEARDAAKYPTMLWEAPHNKELSSPKIAVAPRLRNSYKI